MQKLTGSRLHLGGKREAVMLHAVKQLESQGEGRVSAMEMFLIVGYTSERISNQEQKRDVMEHRCGVERVPLGHESRLGQHQRVLYRGVHPSHQTDAQNYQATRERNRAIHGRDQLKLKLEQVQRLHPEAAARNMKRMTTKQSTPGESPTTHSKTEFKMNVDETPIRACYLTLE